MCKGEVTVEENSEMLFLLTTPPCPFHVPVSPYTHAMESLWRQGLYLGVCTLDVVV